MGRTKEQLFDQETEYRLHYEEMNSIWNQAKSKYRSVSMDTENYRSIFYRGVKVVNDGYDVRVYSLEKEFYEDITDYFLQDDFDIGLNKFLRDKYLRRLDRIDRLIQSEINGNKNHNRMAYLKAMREKNLKKYNEINS